MKSHSSRICRFIVSAFITLAAPWPSPGRAEEPGTGKTTAESSQAGLFSRVHLIGASLTAGFFEGEMLGGKKTPQYSLVNYIEAALQAAHDPVKRDASVFFFTNPEKSLTTQIEAVQKAKPTLVVSLDGVFWFCYGHVGREEDRIARFEKGLELLARIDAPLVLGDIPDARHASGGILNAREVPTPETLSSCNQRLKKWCDGRPNVRLLPLAAMMKACVANEPLEMAGLTWEKGKTRSLLQRDRLHPARHGIAALAIAALDAACAFSPDKSGPVCRNLDTVYREGISRGEKAAASAAPKPGSPPPPAPPTTPAQPAP